MKILFLSSYVHPNSGATALLRLLEPINKKGHTVKVLTTALGHDDKFIDSVRLPRGVDFLNRVINTVLPNYFSLAYHQLKVAIDKFDPDVINIHWTHGFTIPINLIAELTKEYKVFWTIHDLWPITNNKYFEYKNGQNIILNNEIKISQLIKFFRFNPQILFNYKKNLFSKLKLTTISPSVWMQNKIIKSKIFSQSHNIYITNGIDTNIFKPIDKQELRARYDIPQNKKVILTLSAKLTNPRKGVYYFVESMKSLNNLYHNLSKDTIIVTVGKNGTALDKLIPQTCINLGSTSDIHQIAEFYNLADILISTSLGDNLPSTLIEGLACGVPSLGFDVGGINEIIKDGTTGYLVPLLDTDELAKKIHFILTHDSNLKAFSKNSRDYALKKFDVQSQVENYLNLFQESLTSPK